MALKYTKNGSKIDQMALEYTNIFQDPPKFTQIWDSCHLATMVFIVCIIVRNTILAAAGFYSNHTRG
jgi:ABC-type spermidine/putrescine transport system permease subunit I